MITAVLERNAQGALCGLTVEDHGVDFVCSAVSALVLNAINSIEMFAQELFTCDASEAGFIRLDLPNLRAGGANHDAGLLLSSLELGLKGIAEEYPKELTVCEVIQDA